MLFNSFEFIGLLLVTLVIFYSFRSKKNQVSVLVVSSLLFYAYSSASLLLLLLFSAAINILTSYHVVYGKEKNRKSLATFGVIANLSVLAFFKYSPLFAHTFFPEGSTVGDFLLLIPLPIGISFYTFQGISLVVDVYKDDLVESKAVVSPSLLTYAKEALFFIAFFPQLVAGPIVKAHEFLPQIKPKFISNIDWQQCFKNITTGYFLKMVVADNLKDYTFFVAYPYFKVKSTLDLILMLFAYSCQIFADFAGYSLIAIGIAGLFGYKLIDNFNFPYISSSFKEFWKRWHISLSNFLMYYLYFPLGGNRKGKTRTYINLMITMILGGLWHGAAWSYAIWGAFHGIALAVERLVMDSFTFRPSRIRTVFKTIFIFISITLAWLLFKLPDFSHVIEYFRSMGNNTNIASSSRLIGRVLIYGSPVFIYHLFYLLKKHNRFELIRRYEYLGYGLMLFLILTNSGTSGGFIYFQF